MTNNKVVSCTFDGREYVFNSTDRIEKAINADNVFLIPDSLVDDGILCERFYSVVKTKVSDRKLCDNVAMVLWEKGSFKPAGYSWAFKLPEDVSDSGFRKIAKRWW